MKNTPKKSDFAKKVDLAIRRSVAIALAEHKRAGHSIYILKDKKIVEVPAEKIKIDKRLLENK